MVVVVVGCRSELRSRDGPSSWNRLELSSTESGVPGKCIWGHLHSNVTSTTSTAAGPFDQLFGGCFVAAPLPLKLRRWAGIRGLALDCPTDRVGGVVFCVVNVVGIWWLFFVVFSTDFAEVRRAIVHLATLGRRVSLSLPRTQIQYLTRHVPPT